MKIIRTVCLIVGIVIPAYTASANYLQFSTPTDTISVPGNTVLPNENQVTYEAIIDPTSTDQPSEVFSAWEYGAEDEHLCIDSNGSLFAYAFPINWQNNLEGGAVPLNTWVDVAYVYDGTGERLYINGNLVASRAAQITLLGGPWPTNGDL